MPYAQVALPARVFHSFTYRVPEGITLTAEMRVAVPFHRRHAIGFVTELLDHPPQDLTDHKMKEVGPPLDETPVFSTKLLELIRWMARYYCAPIGQVCKTALPTQLTKQPSSRGARRRKPVEDNEALEGDSQPTLTPAQDEAVRTILTELGTPHPQPFLLHGITGSGKTEVYLRVFESILNDGNQAILLVPEIALTSQLAHRVIRRFGTKVAIYHSGLTDAERLEQWKQMQRGEVAIVVGTRSALFAPFPRLRAIVVDEEHDSSYKQDDGFLYHARDGAVMRAHLEGAVAILGSATPSLESFTNADAGKYRYLCLPHRATGALLPSVECVDLRQKPSTTNPRFRGSTALSEPLALAIDETLQRKEQCLLFLNRRGFAHFLICDACGHVPTCLNCNISLTHHFAKQKLICHYCEYAIAIPDRCPQCSGSDMIPVGEGTERLEGELADFFPRARIGRLDRDTTMRRGSGEKILEGVLHGTIDILLGTQLVTKGHDFPGVTLVGIIAADTALHFPDFRAAERTFQLITQVAGRAGRGTKPGRVIVQTRHPDHPSIRHALDHDYQAFFAEERTAREALCYPPFSRLANIRFTGNTLKHVAESARHSADFLRNKIISAKTPATLLGPAPSPLEKIRSKYRWQMLIKAPTAAAISNLLSTANEKLGKDLLPGVRMTIDVDPINLL